MWIYTHTDSYISLCFHILICSQTFTLRWSRLQSIMTIMSFPKEFSMIQNSLPSFSSTPQPDTVWTNPIMMRMMMMMMMMIRKDEQWWQRGIHLVINMWHFSCMGFSGCQTDDFDSVQLPLSVKVLVHSSKRWGAWKTSVPTTHFFSILLWAAIYASRVSTNCEAVWVSSVQDAA